MAIEIVSGEDAWSKAYRHNKQKHWPSRQTADRLHPIATPATEATFKIQADEKIFCIGSCFARELNHALHRAGYNVLSIFNDLPRSGNRKHSDATMCSKYNVASIWNELTWALNPLAPYRHDEVLIENSNGMFEDYQLAGSSYGDHIGPAQEFREAFNLNFSRIREADVVILTLGLSEVWFDKQRQLYLNTTVSQQVVQHYPNRFEMHVFDYAQTLSFLKSIYALLEDFLKPGFRIMITVSPVPLAVTFRTQDVFVANAYSKAVLRAAVEEFIAGKDNINYFPSFEFVALSDSSVVWRGDDFRHVDSTFVDYIMGNVMARFTDAPSTVDADNLRLKAISLYHGNHLDEAKAILNSLLKDRATSSKDVVLLLGAIQLGIDKGKVSTWRDVWTFCKNFRPWNIRQHIRELRAIRRTLANSNFKGSVDYWDGSRLAGWACNLNRDQPIEIRILADECEIAKLISDSPRPDVAELFGTGYLNSGFSITLDVPVSGRDGMRVVFSDTGEDIPGSPVHLPGK